MSPAPIVTSMSPSRSSGPRALAASSASGSHQTGLPPACVRGRLGDQPPRHALERAHRLLARRVDVEHRDLVRCRERDAPNSVASALVREYRCGWKTAISRPGRARAPRPAPRAPRSGGGRSRRRRARPDASPFSSMRRATPRKLASAGGAGVDVGPGQRQRRRARRGRSRRCGGRGRRARPRRRLPAPARAEARARPRPWPRSPRDQLGVGDGRARRRRARARSGRCCAPRGAGELDVRADHAPGRAGAEGGERLGQLGRASSSASGGRARGW